MTTLQAIADALCPAPRPPFSEHDNDRLIHRDLDGCTKAEAADLLVLALVAQQLDHDPWRAERIDRLRPIAPGRKRRAA